MLQKPMVRAASAAIHVAFIALVLSVRVAGPRTTVVGVGREPAGTLNRIIAALGALPWPYS